jgi:hypothetical protein
VANQSYPSMKRRMQVSTAQAGSGNPRRFTTPFGLSLDPGEPLEQLIRVSYYLPEAASPAPAIVLVMSWDRRRGSAWPCVRIETVKSLLAREGSIPVGDTTDLSLRKVRPHRKIQPRQVGGRLTLRVGKVE